MTHSKIDAPKEQPSFAKVKKKPNRSRQLCKLLKRKNGVTLIQIQAAFGWQPHSARAALSRLRTEGYDVKTYRTAKHKALRYQIVRARSEVTEHEG